MQSLDPSYPNWMRHVRPPQTLPGRLLHEWDVIVFAHALQHEEGHRALPPIGDEVRATRADRIGLSGAEPHLLLRFTQAESEVSREDVERILDMAVVMPGHLLRRCELEFGDAEARPLGMLRPALDGVEMAGVLEWFHDFLPA